MSVKIYTTPTCAFCHAEKEFLKEHNIAFEEFDVAVNAQAREEMIQKTGQMGVPVTDINGEIVVGFDRARLKKLLELPK